MSVYDYASVIKLNFDKKIVSDVEIILESQSNLELVGKETVTASASNSYSESYDHTKLYDGNLVSYWQTRSALPQWVKFDLGEEKIINKLRIYSSSTSYMPRAYVLAASNNNADWDTITSGDFANASGWKEVTFDGASYRYWRLSITSGWSTGRLYIWEVELYEELIYNVYEVAGWTVIGQEYNRQPEGSLGAIEYQVRRVTKSEDGLSVYLWLDLPYRMKDPQGLVTVSYSKTLGNLQGEEGSVVNDFEISFTPTGITPIFNPNAIEKIEAELSVESACSLVTRHYLNNDEFIEAELSVVSEIIHIDDIET